MNNITAFPRPRSETYRLRARAAVSSADLIYNVDPKYVEYLVKDQLRRQITEELLKVGEIRTTDDPQSGMQTVELDVYVFTPRDFWSLVRNEAKRLLDESMKHRQY